MTSQVQEQPAQEHQACANTDRELWREREGDYYSDSVHVTESGGIGINCGGYVQVQSLNAWHKQALAYPKIVSLLKRIYEVDEGPGETDRPLMIEARALLRLFGELK